LPTHLNEKLGAFDVRHEWDGVVNRQAASAISVRHEGRYSARASVAHRQIDDQLEFLLRQELRQVLHIASRRFIAVLVYALESPLDWFNLRTNIADNAITQVESMKSMA